MKSEIPLQNQQNGPRTLTLEVFPPLEASVGAPTPHRCWSTAKSTIQSVTASFKMYSLQGLKCQPLKRGSSLLCNVSGLIITRSVHFYLWHFKTGICFQLGNISHTAASGTMHERGSDDDECASESTANCHRVPTCALNAHDRMETCGIHVRPSGQGDHIDGVTGPFPGENTELPLQGFGVSCSPCVTSHWSVGLMN